jgi:hypothetical protein
MKIDNEWLKGHRWMLRTDNNGISYDGFRWEKKGVWTITPDYEPTDECGHGLHGINAEYNSFGLSSGRRVVLCEVDEVTSVEGDKIKTNRAKIVAINEEIPKKAFALCGIKLLKDGDHISCGLYFAFRGEYTITQSGGECRGYDNSVINNKQSGGLCEGNGNSVINNTQSGGECRGCGNSVINNTQSRGYCRGYGNSVINNTQSDGECWGYGNSVINNKQSGGECWGCGNSVINNTQSGGECWGYDNSVINNTQSGGVCQNFNNSVINYL